jgi:DNA primase
MSRLPQGFIDDLVARCDLVQLIASFVPLKKTAKNYSGLCPFHQEKSPSFSVNPHKQFYYCFGCGASGNAVSFIMQYQSMDFMAAVGFLAQQQGVALPEPDKLDAKVYQHQKTLEDVLEAACIFFEAELRKSPQALSYLESRHFHAAVLQQFRVGYAPDSWDALKNSLLKQGFDLDLLQEAGLLSEKEETGRTFDRFRNRVIFPIQTSKGRVAGFGARTLGDEKPKYLNSPETPLFKKQQLLYGQFQALDQSLDTWIVVEGYLDVMAMVQHQINGAIATLGTSLTESHLKLMYQKVNKLVFCFDGDEAGLKASQKAMSLVSPFLNDTRQAAWVFLPDKADPDSFLQNNGKKAFQNLLSEAVPFSDMLFKVEKSINLNRSEDRAAWVASIRPILGAMSPSVFLDLLWQRVSDYAGVELKAQAYPNFANETHVDKKYTEYSSKQPFSKKERFYSKNDYSANVPNLPKMTLPQSASERLVQAILEKPSLVTEFHQEQIAQSPKLSEADQDLSALVDWIMLNPERSIAYLMGQWHDTARGKRLANLLNQLARDFVVDVDEQFNLAWRQWLLQSANHVLNLEMQKTPVDTEKIKDLLAKLQALKADA